MQLFTTMYYCLFDRYLILLCKNETIVIPTYFPWLIYWTWPSSFLITMIAVPPVSPLLRLPSITQKRLLIRVILSGYSFLFDYYHICLIISYLQSYMPYSHFQQFHFFIIHTIWVHPIPILNIVKITPIIFWDKWINAISNINIFIGNISTLSCKMTARIAYCKKKTEAENSTKFFSFLLKSLI